MILYAEFDFSSLAFQEQYDPFAYSLSIIPLAINLAKAFSLRLILFALSPELKQRTFPVFPCPGTYSGKGHPKGPL